ncbi:MAG: penicillin-binding protein 2 [Bacteroidia bacterium]|nr:penicillin-binding protein 2 [Bacteroidia bacterium]MDW8157314.1 penicillin-binding protein 2 [Bacteroidia bacterium]
MNDYKERRQWLLFLWGCIFLIFICRLFFLQVISADYSSRAEKNSFKTIPLQPARGTIYDRNKRIYVTNFPSFDLFITPNELHIPPQDTYIFEKYLKLSRATIRQRIEQAKAYSWVKPSVFEKQISFETYSLLQEHLWRCRGFSEEVRNTRQYLFHSGAHFLGYLGEVNNRDIVSSNNYYRMGDLIGISGLERYYEKELRGKKGTKLVMVDVRGREVDSYAKGKYDVQPVKGWDMEISVDANLQVFGEQLMRNKVGSIVAIEPKTGEILAFVSAPSFDPSLLSGTEVNVNWRKLSKDSLNPLFNRPLMAMYPPGSVFKILNALIALQEGIITEQTVYPCPGFFARNPQGRPRCHSHPGPLSLHGAIQYSCNVYFASLYVDMIRRSSRFDSVYKAYNNWRKYMNMFGVGVKTGVDLPNEKSGLIPTNKFYDRRYGTNKWNGMWIVSNSIGQGEVTMTPLQMANVVCAIANKGYYIEPHFFRRFPNQPASMQKKFKKHVIPIDTTYFNIIIDAMESVVSSGTGWNAYIPGIKVCGKTGTAENPHGQDHSVFFAFAPKEDPKIAIAVIVENAGWGGVWAAPIASLMIEKYLKGNLSPESEAKMKKIIETDFIRPRPYVPNLPQEEPPMEPLPGEPTPLLTTPSLPALVPEH